MLQMCSLQFELQHHGLKDFDWEQIGQSVIGGCGVMVELDQQALAGWQLSKMVEGLKK